MSSPSLRNEPLPELRQESRDKSLSLLSRAHCSKRSSLLTWGVTYLPTSCQQFIWNIPSKLQMHDRCWLSQGGSFPRSTFSSFSGHLALLLPQPRPMLIWPGEKEEIFLDTVFVFGGIPSRRTSSLIQLSTWLLECMHWIMAGSRAGCRGDSLSDNSLRDGSVLGWFKLDMKQHPYLWEPELHKTIWFNKQQSNQYTTSTE